jgi:hypothetical protein
VDVPLYPSLSTDYPLKIASEYRRILQEESERENRKKQLKSLVEQWLAMENDLSYQNSRSNNLDSLFLQDSQACETVRKLIANCRSLGKMEEKLLLPMPRDKAKEENKETKENQENKEESTSKPPRVSHRISWFSYEHTWFLSCRHARYRGWIGCLDR